MRKVILHLRESLLGSCSSPCVYFTVLRRIVGLEKKLTEKVEASVALQTVLDAETLEHTALQGAVHTLCDALEANGGNRAAPFGVA